MKTLHKALLAAGSFALAGALVVLTSVAPGPAHAQDTQPDKAPDSQPASGPTEAPSSSPDKAPDSQPTSTPKKKG